MPSASPNSALRPVSAWTWWICLGTVTLLAVAGEALRWANPEQRLDALTGWLAGNADWLPFLPLLLTAPVWGQLPAVRTRAADPSGWQKWCHRRAGEPGASRWTGLASCGIGLLALTVSLMAQSRFGEAPPAYHDEYSYLFQAQTFLQGRWWLPSHAVHPEWFDQVHVLNEGRFASRYFPGTGFWMAPFVAIGHPWGGHALAQGLAATCLFWIGRELSCNGVGLLSGILFALSPGMIVFSTLLLAHQPTLVGLLFFLWTFLRWQRCGNNVLLLLSGCGLAFAMLCRPMTAAGFALPVGIALAWWAAVGRWPREHAATAGQTSRSFRHRAIALAAISSPLIAGFGVMAVSNQSITGSWALTPYQQYTDLYTPRHRYGFHNVTIGEQHLGPKVLDNYDRWAENLTPALAVRNVWTRWESSERWTLGIVPLSLGGLICLFSFGWGDRRWSLVWGSILCLHLVHVPYWFAGIMGWHYVLESAPCWILLFAEATHRVRLSWQQVHRPGLIWWWNGLLALTLAVNLFTVPPLWPGRLPQGLAELQFARSRYQAFRHDVESLRQGRPAIVFVIPDPADRHMDYVTNSPTLNGPVIVARILQRDQLREAAAEFPDRVPLVFDAAQRQLSLLPPTAEAGRSPDAPNSGRGEGAR